jgi:hypothetical protein
MMFFCTLQYLRDKRFEFFANILLEMTVCWDLRLCRLDSLTQNMKALNPLEALRTTHPTIGRHIPQDVTFHLNSSCILSLTNLLLYVKDANVAYNLQIRNFAILILLIQDLYNYKAKIVVGGNRHNIIPPAYHNQ